MFYFYLIDVSINRTKSKELLWESLFFLSVLPTAMAEGVKLFLSPHIYPEIVNVISLERIYFKKLAQASTWTEGFNWLDVVGQRSRSRWHNTLSVLKLSCCWCDTLSIPKCNAVSTFWHNSDIILKIENLKK